MAQKLTLEEYKKIAYGDWHKYVTEEQARVEHGKNIKACQEAAAYHNLKDRPLDVLIVHGSGRSAIHCNEEWSNSQLLLNGAMKQFKGRKDIKITEIKLREYDISFCNGCYSTTSALCNFPCTCFPTDPMQQLFPLVLRCDVMLISTGVNQSAMSSRLKAFCDRLISLDGGFFITEEQFQFKTPEFKDIVSALAVKESESGDLHYDSRMWGRVAAYFISSKDQNNKLETVAKPIPAPLNYVEAVAWSLRDGFGDYGFFHTDKDWYAYCAADPEEEMIFDKAHYERNTKYQDSAAKVAKAAIELGEKIRNNPPEFDGGARINRT